MPELDEKRVREIVKEEISTHRIPERLSVIETKVDSLANDQKEIKSDIKELKKDIKDEINELKKGIKDSNNEIKKYVIGFSIAVVVAVIGAALAK